MLRRTFTFSLAFSPLEVWKGPICQSLAHHIKSTIAIHARAVILKHIAPAELLLNNITIVKRIAYCVSAYFLWNLWVVWVDIQNINFKCTGFKEGKSFSARNCIPLWEYKGLLGCILGVSIPWQCNWERKPIINLQNTNPASLPGCKTYHIVTFHFIQF